MLLVLTTIIVFFVPKNPLEKDWKEKRKKKKRGKKKILKALAEKSKITNNEVEKLLGVSDATATRYLDELEKEDKIEQVGKRGGFVYYKLKTK